MTTNVGGKMPESWVKNVFSAENERGEGITGRERGVRYWNGRVFFGGAGRALPFGAKTAEKWKMLKPPEVEGAVREGRPGARGEGGDIWFER